MSDNNKIATDEGTAIHSSDYIYDNYASTDGASKTSITKRVTRRAVVALILVAFGLSLYFLSDLLGYYFSISKVRDENNKIWEAVGVILACSGIAQFTLLNYLELGSVFPSLQGIIVTTIITRRVIGRAVVGLIFVTFGLSLYYLSDLFGYYISLGLDLGPPGRDGIQILSAVVGSMLAFAGIAQFSLLNFLEFGSVFPSKRGTIASPISFEREIADQGVEQGPAAMGTVSPVNSVSRKVFLVHGRDEAAKNEVALFLRAIDLDPIILHLRPNGGRHLLTKFREESEGAGFAVVLMTPDDEGGIPGQPMQKRARQNVVFELGFFIGKLGPVNVAALLKSDMEKPSDFDGIAYIAFESGGRWKTDLARELHHAKMPFDPAKALTA